MARDEPQGLQHNGALADSSGRAAFGADLDGGGLPTIVNEGEDHGFERARADVQITAPVITVAGWPSSSTSNRMSASSQTRRIVASSTTRALDG